MSVAMNKAEKAALAQKDIEIEMLTAQLALHVTKDVDFDVAPPKGGYGVVAQGWHARWHPDSLGWGMRAEPALTTAASHAVGKDATRTNRQQGIFMYSTRELALRAIRRQIELYAARELRKCDLLIEQEIENPSTLPVLPTK